MQIALLNFKNAAAEAGNVQGFITGRLVATASRLGFSDFIKGEGAEAWNRLTAASDRFQEGQSRRVGREFGDDRISNYDAEAYKKLVARMRFDAPPHHQKRDLHIVRRTSNPDFLSL